MKAFCLLIASAVLVSGCIGIIDCESTIDTPNNDISECISNNTSSNIVIITCPNTGMTEIDKRR